MSFISHVWKVCHFYQWSNIICSWWHHSSCYTPWILFLWCNTRQLIWVTCWSHWVSRQRIIIISALWLNVNIFYCSGIFINCNFSCVDVYWTWHCELLFGPLPCIQPIYPWPQPCILPEPNSSYKRTCFWKWMIGTSSVL